MMRHDDEVRFVLERLLLILRRERKRLSRWWRALTPSARGRRQALDVEIRTVERRLEGDE